MKSKHRIPRWMFASLFVTTVLVMLSPTALAIRPDWRDCYIDGEPWDPDPPEADCPSFRMYSESWGYFHPPLYEDVLGIYWSYAKIGQETEWWEVDELYGMYEDWRWYFQFEIDVDPAGWTWLRVWAEYETGTRFGLCVIV